MVYAIGVACWLLAPEGLRSRFVAMPTADIVLLGAGAAVYAIDHAAPPIGPVAMALFLAGNSVAELGRKVDVGGERDAGPGPPRDPDGIRRRGTPVRSASAFQPEARRPDGTAQRLSV